MLGSVTLDRLEDRYRILGLLGAGGFGKVFEAERLPPEAGVVALKVFDAPLIDREEFEARLLREVNNARRALHRNVVEVYEHGALGDGRYFYAMEMCRGYSLRQLLRRKKSLETLHAAHIIAQVLDGLSAAHEVGVVHRDMKPENVQLVRSDDGYELAKVIDFGLAKVGGRASQDLSREGQVFGTLAFMAPEQLRGKPADARADLYAVGVMLFEAIAGRRPFVGPDSRAVIAQQLSDPAPSLRAVAGDRRVSRKLDDVVARALAKDPKDRFPSALAMAQALRRAVPQSDLVKVPYLEWEIEPSAGAKEPEGSGHTVLLDADTRSGPVGPGAASASLGPDPASSAAPAGAPRAALPAGPGRTAGVSPPFLASGAGELSALASAADPTIGVELPTRGPGDPAPTPFSGVQASVVSAAATRALPSDELYTLAHEAGASPATVRPGGPLAAGSAPPPAPSPLPPPGAALPPPGARPRAASAGPLAGVGPVLVSGPLPTAPEGARSGGASSGGVGRAGPLPAPGAGPQPAPSASPRSMLAAGPLPAPGAAAPGAAAPGASPLPLPGASPLAPQGAGPLAAAARPFPLPLPVGGGGPLAPRAPASIPAASPGAPAAAPAADSQATIACPPGVGAAPETAHVAVAAPLLGAPVARHPVLGGSPLPPPGARPPPAPGALVAAPVAVAARAAAAPDADAPGRAALAALQAPFARWLLVRRLPATGGVEAYEATDRDTGQAVVLHLLPSWGRLADAERSARRAGHERLALVRHAGLPRLVAAGERADGAPFLAWEASSGDPAQAGLDPARGAGWPCEQAIGVVCQTLEALEALHACDLVHRQVAAENVAIARGGDGPSARLCALAHVVPVTAGERTRWRADDGFARWMPHEQLFGRALDERADVYASGVLLYELVAGRTFEPKALGQPALVPPGAAPAPVAAALEIALRKAIAPRASERFPGARALRRALTPLAGRFAVGEGE